MIIITIARWPTAVVVCLERGQRPFHLFPVGRGFVIFAAAG
jgi:hypothetical protein